MKRSTRWTSGAAVLGAAALGVGLLGYGSGVGAAFTDAVHGNAHIAVGNMSCGISSTDPSVSVAGKTATVDLGTINSSDAGSQTAPVTVTNTGSMPLMVTWAEVTSPSIASSDIAAAATPATAVLSPGSTQTANIGFTWPELSNSDEGVSGTAAYTASCNSNLNVNSNFSLFGQDGGTATWDSNSTPPSVGLTVDPSQASSGAGINISNVPATLPTKSPAFTTDSYGAGTPRLDIEFSDGTYAFEYPAQGGSAWNLPGSTSSSGWSDVENYATSNNLTVKQAFVVMDTSNNASSHANVTCVDYGGLGFGSGC